MTSAVVAIVGLVLALLGPAGGAAAADHKRKSHYTTLDPATCKIVTSHADGNAYRCEGLPGYPIYFAEASHRAFLSFGPRPDKRRAAAQTLGLFNSPFDKAHRRTTIEWRSHQRAGPVLPHAAIVKYFVSNASQRGQVMVVTRIGAVESCHVAYIDAVANADAIVIARRIADEVAPGYDCRSAPRVEGEAGIIGN